MAQEPLNKDGPGYFKAPVFAVAPMIDWTDRHCRFLHRQMSRRALLFTEMVVADAIIHGPRARLLGHHAAEHPLALQLGGSDPVKLKQAVRIAADYGYDEINLNVGCPSDRVQSGTFGACLMKTPDVVAECVEAMKSVATVPVTVKCRIGVDDQNPQEVLPAFLEKMIQVEVGAVWIHARKAWLQGLSPKENRDIPPLDYDLVHAMKREFPNLFMGINGGIETLSQGLQHLSHMDGIMLGRAVYHHAAMLSEVDHLIYGDAAKPVDWNALCDTLMGYAGAHIAEGGKLSNVTRHMVGLFSGISGARRFRQILSTEATRPGAGPEVIAAAFSAIDLEEPATA
ncbi:tRNA dihydrouridine(20/20a) synthase DusA [Rhizobiaceae bacterium BDR2-2]|uniref:tRNA-dihydrouridine(20/20a) synthase n=1 Tax=Ectorhizobium quercum TaxID=2965071 RepID=A0AAE3SXI0_9HYPH|nr:tRNA dihydrouridine(20/20a) synthase DusA [Ectorhizobium quercum]MCX8999803.1 tRNA dihydrouridine(20/20a) synthase DusA [Ectorhizobium quercum]